MGKKLNKASLFELNGVPDIGEACPLALQHVVAMIVGCVTPAIIIGGAAGLESKDKVILIQAALVVAGISTLIQLFPLGGKLGSGLPIIMGTSFAYLPSMQGIVEGYDLATLFGAQLVGGIFAILVGLFVKKLRKFFPPLITGTVVFTIGLSLYPTAVNYMAGGTSSPEYGSIKNWAVAFLTLAVVVILNHFAKGILKLASILVGMVVGYITALCLGMVDFSGVGSAGFFAAPKPLHFGMKFELSCIITLSVLFIINSIQAIGDYSATTNGGLGREPEDKELKGGITAYGITNILGSFLCGLPTATFSQNVGIVVTTKVVNKVVFGMAAGVILLAGLVPKFSALLTTISQCVLGGATISVFASIAMTGIKLITQKPLTYRSTSIVGLSVALGMGITQASAALANFPDWVMTIFGKSPVVITTIMAVFLNLVLPKEKEA